MVAEEWREVSDMPGYDASSLGRVRSWRGPGGHRRLIPRLRKPVLIKRGYMTIVFMRDQKHALSYVHHMVLFAFVGPMPDGKEARHKDGDSTNNVLKNLAWGTPTENEADKVRHGTHTRGERNGGAKMTQRMADTVRARLAKGEQGRKLAQELRVSEATICRIRKGVRYAGC